MAISKVRKCMLWNYGCRSSLKSQTPHTSPSTTHSSKIPQKHKFHWKGKKRCALHQNQPSKKISMNYDHKAIKLIMTTSLFLITYQNQLLSEIPQHKIIGYEMVFIIENHNYTAMIGIGYLDLANKNSEDSPNLQIFLLYPSNLH